MFHKGVDQAWGRAVVRLSFVAIGAGSLRGASRHRWITQSGEGFSTGPYTSLFAGLGERLPAALSQGWRLSKTRFLPVFGSGFLFVMLRRLPAAPSQGWRPAAMTRTRAPNDQAQQHSQLKSRVGGWQRLNRPCDLTIWYR